MNKLTGYGIPTPSTVGQVGQYYEDLNTGNLYECRISSKYSPTHGWPVGGYVWELRAKGEDIQELYGSGGGSGGAVDNRVHLGIGTGNSGEHTMFVYDTATDNWVRISANELYKKLKSLGFQPQITLTEIPNRGIDEDSHPVLGMPTMPFDTACCTDIGEYGGGFQIHIHGIIMDGIRYCEGPLNRLWIEILSLLDDDTNEEVVVEAEYLDLDEGGWVTYPANPGPM